MAKRKSAPIKQSRLTFILTVVLFVTFLLIYFVGKNLDIFPAPPAANEYTEVASGKTLEMHVIDVGQGDSILIKAPGGTALIDAGTKENGPVVYDYLTEQGIDTLDLVINTHPHADHVGGMGHVISSMKQVGTVIMPDLADSMVPTTRAFETFLDAVEERDLSLSRPKVGQVYSLGTDATLTILGPVAQYNDMNDNSVVCRIDFGETSFLLTGDSELRAEWEIVSSGGNVTAQVLKVGHHGSSTSTDEDWLDEVKPAVALISCAVDNSYGHPHREVTAALEAADIPIYRTDLQGSLVVTSDGKELSVSTER